MRQVLLAAVPLLLLAPAPAVAAAPVHCRLADPRITEASALVDLGSVLVTSNDSGDSARVFVLDPRTCRTVGVTSYGGEAVDVEALAPAGRHAVWVGDIGDNLAQRSSVSVIKVPVARGDRTVAGERYPLTYPDGPHDAESLFADRTGRLYVVTKAPLGGSVYVAPRMLRTSGPNRLRRLAPIDTWATDAAAWPGGRWVLVRSYVGATVYALGSFRPAGTFALPAEPQGEGISVGRHGRVLVDTEGVGTPIQQVTLQAGIRRLLSPSPSRSPSGSASPQPGSSVTPSTDAGSAGAASTGAGSAGAASTGARSAGAASTDPLVLVAGSLGALLLIVLGTLAFRRRPRR